MTREQIKEAAMSKIDDGGPVHPVHGYQMDAGGAYCGQWVAENGLSLRDYFAAASLQGQRAADPGIRTPWSRIRNWFGYSALVALVTSDSAARVAYHDADAMLQQRKEQL